MHLRSSYRRRVSCCALTPVSRLICFAIAQVCELDIIFNFHKAYYILDEVLVELYVEDKFGESSIESSCN